jgi:Reverse transcriptase (RNA-dependent DNA polymerase)
VETDLYMEIPAGFNINGSWKNQVLKLFNNLYRQNQAGRVWNLYLKAGLIKLGFKQSKEDPCIFWRDGVVIIIFTDDTIVTEAIKDISSLFEITVKDMVDDFLGLKISRNLPDGQGTLTQPQLISSILTDLKLGEHSDPRPLPTLVDVILHPFLQEPEHSESWHYRSIVGKLNYLEYSTRLDLAYAVHQCARFSEKPKESHSKAIKHTHW